MILLWALVELLGLVRILGLDVIRIPILFFMAETNRSRDSTLWSKPWRFDTLLVSTELGRSAKYYLSAVLRRYYNRGHQPVLSRWRRTVPALYRTLLKVCAANLHVRAFPSCPTRMPVQRSEQEVS